MHKSILIATLAVAALTSCTDEITNTNNLPNDLVGQWQLYNYSAEGQLQMPNCTDWYLASDSTVHSTSLVTFSIQPDGTQTVDWTLDLTTRTWTPGCGTPLYYGSVIIEHRTGWWYTLDMGPGNRDSLYIVDSASGIHTSYAIMYHDTQLNGMHNGQLYSQEMQILSSTQLRPSLHGNQTINEELRWIK